MMQPFRLMWPAHTTKVCAASALERLTEPYRYSVQLLPSSSWIEGLQPQKAKKSLKDQVKQMVLDGGWPAALEEWSTHIRESGNAGAHPDIFGKVSQEEAEDLRDLVHQLIEVVYVVPAKIAKARSRRAGP